MVENLHPFFSWLKAHHLRCGKGVNVPFATLYNNYIAARNKNQRAESRIAVSKLLASIGVESERRRVGADQVAWVEVSFVELRRRFAAKGWIHPTDEVPDSERCPLADVYGDLLEDDDEPEPADDDAPEPTADELETSADDASKPTAVDDAPETSADAPETSADDFTDLLAEILGEEPDDDVPKPTADEPEPPAVDFANLMDEIIADLDG